MALEVGIVGLPNVGKSTIFNALTSARAPAANYPFCTIDPNTGVEMIRAGMENVPLTRDQPASWEFYGPHPHYTPAPEKTDAK